MKEWFKKECAVLRTGRATPALVENILVESYGARTPMKNIAAIGIEDAKTIRIAPWDTSVIKDIERAIANSNLGVQPISSSDSVRLRLPDLTEERREMLVKTLYAKLEEAKISLRKERDEVWKDIQEKERSGELTEDDKYAYKEDLQKIIDSVNADLEETAEAKEEEIKS